MNPQNYDLAVRLRHELHMHPELPNHETWTKARLMSFLEEHTQLEVVDRGAWFYAVYRAAPQAPRIAFRADFDALPLDETISLPYGSLTPGISHKCRHDRHSASLAGFALEASLLRPRNNLYFIFQHAEETGEGARVCAELIKEEHIDEVYGYHNEPGYPLGDVILCDGVMQCASTGMTLSFQGASAHASDPEIGRNPAPAIARLISVIPALTRPEDHRGLVLCTVVHVKIGDPSFGTSPGDGVLCVTLRAQYEEELHALQTRLDTLAYCLAAEYGLSYQPAYSDYFPENRNHTRAVQKIVSVCHRLGIPVHEFPQPKRGSEDFGYYTKATTGAFFNIGAGAITPHHTLTYDFPDAIIPVAVDLFKGLAGLDGSPC